MTTETEGTNRGWSRSWREAHWPGWVRGKPNWLELSLLRVIARRWPPQLDTELQAAFTLPFSAEQMANLPQRVIYGEARQVPLYPVVREA